MNRALGLIGRPDMTRSKFPQLGTVTVEDWTKESFELTKSVAYQDGAIQGIPAGKPVRSFGLHLASLRPGCSGEERQHRLVESGVHGCEENVKCW